VGGISNQILLLLNSYEKINGIKVSLITRFSKYKPGSDRIKIYKIHKFHNIYLDQIYFNIKTYKTILKIHKREPIDILNIHHYTHFKIVPILIRLIYKIPLLMKLPIDFEIFSRLIFESDNLKMKIFGFSWLKFFKKFLLKKINFIRAINNKMYEDLIVLKYPKENILRIPNGINSGEFANIEKRKKDIIHYAFVGRLVKIKNLRILLHAFKEYLSHFTSDKLFIYGFGPERDWISNFIKENKLSKSIILCGFEKDKNRIYSNVDALIDSSLAQGISNSILEAMCTNTLVVASNVAGNRDLIKHKLTGLLFNLSKKEDLLKQLLFCKNNPEIVKLIIRNAKKEILKIYDIDEITNNIYSFLKINLS